MDNPMKQFHAATKWVDDLTPEKFAELRALVVECRDPRVGLWRHGELHMLRAIDTQYQASIALEAMWAVHLIGELLALMTAHRRDEAKLWGPDDARRVWEVEQGGATWWVTANSEAEAIALASVWFSDDDDDDDGDDGTAKTITESDARAVALHNATFDNMWDAHCASPEASVLGCTEWVC